MTRYASAYGLALVLFLVLDALWLGVIARNLYVSRMGDLMLDRPNWGVAAIFYLLYIVGLVYFAISGGLVAASWQKAGFDGALFGFFAYLTYNFTNLSVIRGFDPLLAVVDTSWGTVMGGLVAGLTVAILLRFGWA